MFFSFSFLIWKLQIDELKRSLALLSRTVSLKEELRAMSRSLLAIEERHSSDNIDREQREIKENSLQDGMGTKGEADDAEKEDRKGGKDERENAQSQAVENVSLNDEKGERAEGDGVQRKEEGNDELRSWSPLRKKDQKLSTHRIPLEIAQQRANKQGNISSEKQDHTETEMDGEKGRKVQDEDNVASKNEKAEEGESTVMKSSKARIISKWSYSCRSISPYVVANGAPPPPTASSASASASASAISSSSTLSSSSALCSTSIPSRLLQPPWIREMVHRPKDMYVLPHLHVCIHVFQFFCTGTSS